MLSCYRKITSQAASNHPVVHYFSTRACTVVLCSLVISSYYNWLRTAVYNKPQWTNLKSNKGTFSLSQHESVSYLKVQRNILITQLITTIMDIKCKKHGWRIRMSTFFDLNQSTWCANLSSGTPLSNEFRFWLQIACTTSCFSLYLYRCELWGDQCTKAVYLILTIVVF